MTDERAQEIAARLAAKPLLLIEVFDQLYRADPPLRVLTRWVHRTDNRIVRRNLLTNGTEVGIVVRKPETNRWLWIAHLEGDPGNEKQRMNGEAPTWRLAASAVDHFLKEAGWAFPGMDSQQPLDTEDPRSEGANLESDLDAIFGEGASGEPPPDEESSEDMPF